MERSHDLFKGIKVDDPESFKAQVLNNNNNNNNTETTIIDNNNSNNKNKRISVLELYKLPKDLRNVFGSIRGEFGDCLKSNEVNYYNNSNNYY